VPIGRSERRKIVDRGSVNLLVLLEPPIIPASLVEIDLVGLLDFGKNRQDRIVVIHDLACPKDLAVSRTMSITDQLYLESETRCPTHRRINAALRDEAADNECLDRELVKALFEQGSVECIGRVLLNDNITLYRRYGGVDMPAWRVFFKDAVVTAGVLQVYDGNAARPGPINQSSNIAKYDVAVEERPAQAEKRDLSVNN
jgi:hypothetical protein